MKKKHHKKVHLFLIVILILIVFGIYFLGPKYYGAVHPEKIKNFILSFGVYSSLAFIILQAVQTAIPFVPFEISTTVGGYLFGFVKGFIYSLVGIWLGSSVLFVIGKKFGRILVKKLVDKEHLRHFKAFFKKRGIYAFILANWLLIFPEDTLTIILVSFSKIRYPKFLIATIIGYLPFLTILTLFGDQITKKLTSIWLAVSFVFLFAIVLLYTFRKKVKMFFIKEAREIREEIKKIENNFK